MSRNPDWLNFLKETDQSLFYDLNNFLRHNSGCRNAKEKMLEIYKQLYEKGNGELFEQFIRRRFAYIIEDDSVKRTPRKRPYKKIYAKKPAGPVPSRLNIDSSMNKHKVFKNYRPDMLTFPQKLILVDEDSKSLLDKVKNFIADKSSADYIIIDDRAYIEYFLPKYKEEAEKIPSRAREIYQFRMKQAQEKK